MRLLTKKELEEIALSEIVDGPQWNVSGSRVFEIRREWMKWAAEEAAQIAKANTMGELEAVGTCCNYKRFFGSAFRAQPAGKKYLCGF